MALAMSSGILGPAQAPINRSNIVGNPEKYIYGRYDAGDAWSYPGDAEPKPEASTDAICAVGPGPSRSAGRPAVVVVVVVVVTRARVEIIAESKSMASSDMF